MSKRIRKLLVLFLIIFVSSLSLCKESYADLNVVIKVNPNVIEVPVGSAPIALEAKVKGTTLTFKWDIYGPGKLKGNLHSSAIFYVPPGEIDGKSAEVIITVEVKETISEESTEEAVFFKIISKPPTPTPTPTPIPPLTPIPTPMPTQQGMSTSTKIAIGAGTAAALGVGICVAAGCFNGDGDGDDKNFVITYPQDNQVVYQRYIEVTGVGMKENVTTFRCSVFTNQWFEQNNQYDGPSGNDGSWRTSVTLGGMDQHNNHTIKVEVTYSNGKMDSAQVTGVVVRE